MFSRCSIRVKLAMCLLLLAASMITMTWSGFRATTNYRSVARGVSRRARELPLASDFARQVSNLRVTFARLCQVSVRSLPGPATENLRAETLDEFRVHFRDAESLLGQYQIVLDENAKIEDGEWRVNDHERSEAVTLREIRAELNAVRPHVDSPDFILAFDSCVADIEESLTRLQGLSTELPSFLQTRMGLFKDDVQGEYRRAYWVMGIASAVTLVMLGLLVNLLYLWLLKPIREMLRGSRRVAAGDFFHRIQLSSKDEMAELASAMNDMTSQFQQIRDDLDAKVRRRTQEVIRNEKLASVGFLAAGVAHEINNPLASIALCAESLEDRLHDIIVADDALPDEEHNSEIGVCRNYLRMMQDEAFRCKEITDGLLDFARLGDTQRQATDLADIAHAVLDMVRHLAKYREKSVCIETTEPVIAWANPPELKQVVLNLVTNGLDSVDAGGEVRVRLDDHQGAARIVVQDNGCGMSAETLEHLYEPFYTRRRDGQGTGLGLSITYRIVTDHGGTIRAESEGPGQGATITITLPQSAAEPQEAYHQYEAA